jgi:hypothetical protein
MDILLESVPVVVALLNGGVSGPKTGKKFCIARNNVDVTKVMSIFQIRKSEQHDPLRWSGVLPRQ